MNCKPGDLAFTRGESYTPPDYVGRFVEVVEVCQATTRILAACEAMLGQLWFVRPLGGWIPSDCELNGRGTFIYPDGLLRPIRGLPVTEDERDEVKV